MSCSSPLVTVDCSLRHYEGEHAAHAHDGHAQLLYALHGRMELEIDGHSAYVDTATGLLIPPGARHSYLATQRACMVVLDVAPQLSSGLERVRRFQVPAATRCAPDAMATMDRLQLLLQAPAQLPRRKVDANWLEVAVRQQLHAPWPTRRMANCMHLSTQRFHTRWQELTGLTPQQWLRQLRLDTATQMLAQGRSLDATAAACGYATSSALAYALRRDRHTSARQLRRAASA